MTKPFAIYQYLVGEKMTDRDVKEVNSKFWNKGKWDNFVLPFLPEDCSGQIFVDMGCNAGLFLKLAEDKGFGEVFGVDSNADAVQKGMKWEEEHGGKYRFVLSDMEDCIDKLPVTDYTVLTNAHYYFTIDNWIDYLDKLQYKTRYCIVVTTEKMFINRCWPKADVNGVRNYFKGWKEVGFIDELPTEGDPSPRRLWGLCFESPYIKRVPTESLDSSNHVQDRFYSELDGGKKYEDTKYFRVLKRYRKHWSPNRLTRFIEDKINIYRDLKENGLKKALLVTDNRILDGNHRYSMMKSLGYKSVLIREI